MKKSNFWTIIIILAVIILAFAILQKPKPPETTEEIAKCIGENSVLYVQLGCRHCEDQEEMFGENVKYLNKVDCFFEKEICQEKQIGGTPTWIIKGEEYESVREIEELRDLTGC